MTKKKTGLPLRIIVPRVFFESDRFPTAQELIDASRKRASGANGSGDPRTEWEYVLIVCARAEKALHDGDSDLLALEMYHLGELIRTLDLLEPKHQKTVAKLLETAPKQKVGLKNQGRQRVWGRVLKERARRLAARRWKDDVKEEIYLSRMCSIVWPLLWDFIEEQARPSEKKSARTAMPNSEKGLKNWLRPVAPEHASRPGRRKKT